MTWIYYTGRTLEDEKQFCEDYKDADRLVFAKGRTTPICAEYAEYAKGNAAWACVTSRLGRVYHEPD